VAGIEPLARLLFTLAQAHPMPHPRFLDVGTGFGFAVSMAQSLGWEAAGVEPSDFGRHGSQALGIHIVQEYLGQAGLLENSFDYVLLADVIEHVADPKGLFALAARYLAGDGVMLITTPNSEVLYGDQEEEVIDLFSPGYHLTLLSPQSLRLVLEELGFHEIRMLFEGGTSGRRMITALVSRGKGAFDPGFSWTAPGKKATAFVDRYLEQLLAKKEHSQEKDIVYGGTLFRLFTGRIRTRDYAGADAYARRITSLIESSGWTTRRIAKFQADDFASYVEQAPAYLGMFCFYRGLLHTRYHQDLEAAVCDFKAAVHLFQVEQQTRIYPRVGWPERALYHLGMAQWRRKKFQEALSSFEQLVAHPQAVPDELWKDIDRHKGLAHLRLWQLWPAARYLWRSMCRQPMSSRGQMVCKLVARLVDLFRPKAKPLTVD
jgi:SAM-dependent methyltransferase